MKRSKSSHRWLQEHHNDPYVKLARASGYRSRAAFKLEALQRKYHLVKVSNTVVDLGAAPGGWSQLLVDWVGENGRVVALDLLPIQPLIGVECIRGDFSDPIVLEQLLTSLGDKKIDVVCSDIAPNMSGVKAVDQAKGMYLVELVVDFVKHYLATNGTMAIKVFQGEGFDACVLSIRKMFKKVIIQKPDASRGRSREVYILGLNKLEG
ncbi:MAG: 23S rRNA (uridine(2552)-2'-O)-methyltransferase RlmE [Gammaproteobacteria bacterium]|nr:23S rRNA (uridine(2552)-2'-O)-methyltransferase RlmE [Gammaproteobacteria bacterium]MCD8542012.1 23S rRNA (uridine(2552)-2'-O)-methyltransferase RlmE [Gammaproteobacteria bacterium]